MDLRLGSLAIGPEDFAIMTDATSGDADIVVVTADPAVVARARADAPGAAVAVTPASRESAAACLRAGADLLIGDEHAGLAARTGSAVACSDPDRAVAAGVRGDGVLVRAVDAATVRRFAGRWPVLATPGGSGSAALAVLSVFAWLGARVLRIDDVPAARQALDMVASMRGTRPPAVARRGLV